MYPRLRLDITTRDLLYGLSCCVGVWSARECARRIGQALSAPEESLVCLSVRSGFDLLLGVLSLPGGSEVLVSAVTHPDMVRIIEGHGLRAVPVDLDPKTLAPKPRELEVGLTSRTRAILVAHLFGSRVDLGPISGFAKEHDLLLVEDCAQAFQGTWDAGDARAHVSMFSFGPIKTATALGGAILYVRDPDTLRKMRNRQSLWPAQPRPGYAGRLLKSLVLVQATRPVAFGLLFRGWWLLGKDFDALVSGAARAFPARRGPGAQGGSNGPLSSALFARIRRQPSAPLLALLARRLHAFDADRLARRARIGEKIAHQLSNALSHPGNLANDHTHWLFPVTVRVPDYLVSALRRKGFDAARATSNIAVVEAPANRPDCAPEQATAMMDHLVFLPVYPQLPDSAVVRLVQLANEVAEDLPGG